MPRKSIEQRIAQYDAKKQKLVARMKSETRKLDTRRKVLLGAFTLEQLTNHPDPIERARLAASLRRELGKFLTRPADRELFADLIGEAA